MKIVNKKKKKLVQFHTLPDGAIFRSDGAYYSENVLFMKMHKENNRNAVDIEKSPGKQWSFSENEGVEPINCELHIND